MSENIGEEIRFLGEGAIGIIALWVVLVNLPRLIQGIRAGANAIKVNGTVGSQSVSFWREQVREIVKDVLKEGFAERNEAIRKIIREEVERLKE